MRPTRRFLALATVALVLTAAGGCGREASASGDGPTVAVTTSLLGDVVQEVVGDEATVTVLMPPGADPHDVALSAQQAAEVREADALITNGGGFEEGMLDGLESAEADGVPTFEALGAVEPLDAADGPLPSGQEDRSDEGDHADEGDDHGGADPHFFTDASRMAAAAEGIAAFLSAEVPALRTDAFRQSAAAEVASLEELDAVVDDELAVIPPEGRTLVTNHAVFGYFADRYGFEVVGAVIPGGGTGAEPNAQDLDVLASTLEAEQVPAIFADVSSPESLSEALADEVGDVEVVALFTESLGEDGSEGDTYAAMMLANAERIVAALT